MDTGQFNLTPGAMECKQFGSSLDEVVDFADTPGSGVARLARRKAPPFINRLSR